MAWYDKYYNKITLNNHYYFCVKDGKVYPAASKCIHPRGKHCVQWFEYYKKDKKYIRVYQKDTMFRHFIQLNSSEVKEQYPEYFFDI